MNRIFIIALCVLIFSGCGTVTPREMRTDHAHHSQFEVDGSLQTVIKNISKKTEECGFNFIERITLLEELGEAHIEYRSVSGADVLFGLVDLNRQNGKTRVDIYATYKMHDNILKTLEYGAKGFPGCP